MKKCSKREVALIAELLADKLIPIYRNEQIPSMVEGFASAGFSKTALEHDPAKLFQMLVVAAYDRRPFTPAASGFEVVWGIRPGLQSIPQVLTALSLFTPEEVRHLDRDTIHHRLDSKSYFGLSMATDGENVLFARTLLDLAQLIEGSFHNQVRKANTSEDVREIYKTLTNVHGIGDTIGAKLVKYLLREIGVGRMPAGAFPLTVAWPIAAEYHVNAATERLSTRLDSMLVPLTMGELLSRREPLAIDALFYLHRHRNWELDEFIEEMQRMIRGRRPPKSPPEPQVQTSNIELAQKLLAVIREIYEASRGISPAEIQRAGLKGIMTVRQIEDSARWLYREMGELASEGKANEMMAFYQNCLHSERGKIIGWALEQLGRTSMESEAGRFRAIFEEGCL